MVYHYYSKLLIKEGTSPVILYGDFEIDYDEIFRVIKENNINVAIITPTLIKLCLINQNFNSVNYPSLKCIYFCGEILIK